MNTPVQHALWTYKSHDLKHSMLAEQLACAHDTYSTAAYHSPAFMLHSFLLATLLLQGIFAHRQAHMSPKLCPITQTWPDARVAERGSCARNAHIALLSRGWNLASPLLTSCVNCRVAMIAVICHLTKGQPVYTAAKGTCRPQFAAEGLCCLGLAKKGCCAYDARGLDSTGHVVRKAEPN